MIRLGTKSAPTWLDLPQGVRLRLRPFNAAHEFQANRVGMEFLRNAGDEPDWAQYELEVNVALAKARVDVWEGVEEEDGTPAACTPENIEALLRNVEGMALVFRREYTLYQTAVREEKKDYAPSQNGTGNAAGAPASAEPA